MLYHVVQGSQLIGVPLKIRQPMVLFFHFNRLFQLKNRLLIGYLGRQNRLYNQSTLAPPKSTIFDKLKECQQIYG